MHAPALRSDEACVLMLTTLRTMQNGESRVKGEEIVCPIAVGTVAWWQGKKVGFVSVQHLNTKPSLLIIMLPLILLGVPLKFQWTRLS